MLQICRFTSLWIRSLHSLSHRKIDHLLSSYQKLLIIFLCSLNWVESSLFIFQASFYSRLYVQVTLFLCSGQLIKQDHLFPEWEQSFLAGHVMTFVLNSQMHWTIAHVARVRHSSCHHMDGSTLNTFLNIAATELKFEGLCTCKTTLA